MSKKKKNENKQEKRLKTPPIAVPRSFFSYKNTQGAHTYRFKQKQKSTGPFPTIPKTNK
jgi:hypothetical protein